MTQPRPQARSAGGAAPRSRVDGLLLPGAARRRLTGAALVCAVALTGCGAAHRQAAGPATGLPTAASAVPATGSLEPVDLVPPRAAPLGTAATGSARTWLRRYVQPDGRVARLDQGGDTVSAGQSYALMLALAVRDDALFDRVWSWTRVHLQRPDGLLAFHASATGQVLDQAAATDADLVVAWALLRRGNPAGPALAAAVRRLETVQVGAQRVLAAGPWAVGPPTLLNPSYWAFPVLRDLDRLDPTGGWGALADGAAHVLAQLPAPLPPDWVHADGATVGAEPEPDGLAPVQYGPDAQRVVAWSAWSCVAGDQAAARRAVGALGTPSHATDLRGAPTEQHPAALAQVAATAARTLVGDTAGARDAGAAALAAEAQEPTYYGSIWLALAQVRTALFPC